MLSSRFSFSSFTKRQLNFQGPSSCYLSMILRVIINNRHNDDKRILNFLSHFSIRTALDYGKSDYPYAPFTKEKPWWKIPSDMPKVTRLGSGGAGELCSDLCHPSTGGIHWQARGARKIRPRKWDSENFPHICVQRGIAHGRTGGPGGPGNGHRVEEEIEVEEEAVVFRRQTAARWVRQLSVGPPLVTHPPFSYLKKNTGNFYLPPR